MSSLVLSSKPQIWLERIHEQKSSSLSIAVWCKQNQIPYQTFCYWKRRLTKPSITQVSFIEQQEKDTQSGIQLECKGIKVHLEKDFDSSTLSRVLTLLKVK